MTKEVQSYDFIEHVRLRPSMYIGSTGSEGKITLLKNLFARCIEYQPEEQYSFKISLGKEENIELDFESTGDLSSFLETKNFTLNKNSIFDLKILEALAQNLEIVKKSDKKAILKFQFDTDIFENQNFDFNDLDEKFLEFSFTNRNVNVLITDNRSKILKQNFHHHPEGIFYISEKAIKNVLGTPKFRLQFDGQTEKSNVQFMLAYRTDWYPQPHIIAYGNDVHNICGGSLVDGILEGFKNGCKTFIKSEKLENFKIKKKSFSNGLLLFAAARNPNYKFGGSWKETLENVQLEKSIAKLTKKLTLEYMMENKNIALEFLNRFNQNNIFNTYEM